MGMTTFSKPSHALSRMMSSCMRITFLLCWSLTFLPCMSSPLLTKGHGIWRYKNGTKIHVQELYSQLPLKDIPTTVDEDVLLSNVTEVRYGYLMGRPITCSIRNRLGMVLNPLLDWVWSGLPSFLHWGVLISREPPYNISNHAELLPYVGKRVPRPETGLIFELRHSANTGLVYLDLKNWISYEYRQDKLKFEGTLNKTDAELITIGRAYIQHVGKEGGYHSLYRNCQIFTAWYIKELWPKAPLNRRFDQLFGKMAWWFKDWSKTSKWGTNKIKGWLGFRKYNVEEVDSPAEFIGVEKLLSTTSDSDREITK